MTHPSDDLTLRHLARVVESSDDAIVSKSLEGVILSWNRAAERMFGYPADEAIGRNIRMIIPADRQAEEDRVIASIRAGEAVTHYETIRQRKDGTLLPISLTVSPIYDDAGTVTGASTIVRDISDRERSALTAERLTAVVESSDDAIVTKDLTSTIMTWNRAAERLFGYTESEAIGRSIRMLIPPECQAEEDLVLSKIRAGDRVEHYETTRVRKDGTRIQISLTVSPIRDRAGRIVGASKIARDITERVRLESLAREHAADAEKVGEVGAVVASTLDRETIVQKVTDVATALTRAEFGAFFYNVVDVNSGNAYLLYTLSGAPREAFAAFPHPRATDVFGPTFRGEGPVRMDDVTRDPRYGRNPPYFGMPKGHLPVRSYLAVPVKGVRGDVIGGLFFGHSAVGMFTERHERLALGVAAWASVALENARLYGDAQHASRIKDEFLAVLSHELRTPLNAILGYARLLRGSLLDPAKVDRALETLERNATALSQIVEDVLDVSRIISGKMGLDVRPVELPALVDYAAATVQPAADAKGIQLHTAIEPGVNPVSGDPDRLRQVIWNLLSNAVKFTPRGGHVYVHLARVHSHVQLSVRDTGTGIRPDFLPYVFERFRQEDASLTRKVGGLGLGLAIVRHIVEMHGGTVAAESEGEGTGATFTVRLPLMAVHQAGVDSKRDLQIGAPQPALATLGDLNGIHVLAVDDECDALNLLAVVLESAGARVTTVSSASEALGQLSAAAPDVVVADIGMPAVDGFQLIKQIRASEDPAVRGVPAAALTAYARSEDRTRALRSGFDMHLAKPIDPAELVASVSMLARRARQDR